MVGKLSLILITLVNTSILAVFIKICPGPRRLLLILQVMAVTVKAGQAYPRKILLMNWLFEK